MAVAIDDGSVTLTRRSREDADMDGQRSKSSAGWQLCALAALSAACAVLLLLRGRPLAQDEALDPYQQWWQRRERIRAGGEHNPHLFV
jgi:hypothetical protein